MELAVCYLLVNILRCPERGWLSYRVGMSLVWVSCGVGGGFVVGGWLWVGCGLVVGWLRVGGLCVCSVSVEEWDCFCYQLIISSITGVALADMRMSSAT